MSYISYMSHWLRQPQSGTKICKHCSVQQYVQYWMEATGCYDIFVHCCSLLSVKYINTLYFCIVGRIGASQSKAACHTNPALPSRTLVQAYLLSWNQSLYKQSNRTWLQTWSPSYAYLWGRNENKRWKFQN